MRILKKFVIFLLTIAMCLSMAACVSSGTQGARTIVDSEGREVAVPETMESIVCVGVGAL